ncbi:hypothetical protein DX910_13565 [Acinetobacter haemolyticus]|nr:hypothetical protein DX910_13565 [Acinetobacter haemolyticus]
MFKALKEILLTIGIQFAETNYMRLIAAFAVIIPLVLAMYGFLDEAIFNTKDSLNDISNYSHDGFPIGAYALAYMGVAKFDVALTTIFFYMTTAIVWSFTTDLQPALVAGKRK